MLNNIHERGLSKQHTVKVKNFPGATTETILEKLEYLPESTPDILIVHAGNNLTKIPKTCECMNEKFLQRKRYWVNR